MPLATAVTGTVIIISGLIDNEKNHYLQPYLFLRTAAKIVCYITHWNTFVS